MSTPQTPAPAAPPPSPPIDIMTVAETRLGDWIVANGGSMNAIGAPTPGTFIATLLAFLAKILPLLGCALPLAKQTVMDFPNRAKRVLARHAAREGFAFNEIPEIVDASMHLLTVSSADEYAAFAAAA